MTGIDLVQAQIKVAGGMSLTDLGLVQSAITLNGWAIQCRVTLQPGKEAEISQYHEPSQPGVRVDSGVAAGRTPSARYDPLLAKLICSVDEGQTFAQCVEKTVLALDEFKLEGVKTNSAVLKNILQHPAFAANQVYTKFMADFGKELNKVAPAAAKKQQPLGEAKLMTVMSPFPGEVAEVKVKVGDKIGADDIILVVSAMKMLNDVLAPGQGVVKAVHVEVGEQVDETKVLVEIEGHVTSSSFGGDAEFGDSMSGAPATLSSSLGVWLADQSAVQLSPHTPGPVLRSSLRVGESQYNERYAHNLALAAELQERKTAAAHGKGGKYTEVQTRETLNHSQDSLSELHTIAAAVAISLSS